MPKVDIPYPIAQGIMLEWAKRHPGQACSARPHHADGIVPLDRDAVPADCRIVCARVSDLPVPHERDARMVPCTRCDALVWLSQRSPRLVHGEIICMQCAVPEMLRDMIDEAKDD